MVPGQTIAAIEVVETPDSATGAVVVYSLSVALASYLANKKGRHLQGTERTSIVVGA